MTILSRIKYFIRKPQQLIIVIITRLPYFSFIKGSNHYQNQVTFEFWVKQKVFGIGNNRNVYWPVHPTSQIYNPERIYVGIDTCPGLSKGCYIQGSGGIYIGDYTQIAPNVVISSDNHNIYDLREYSYKKVEIGKYCWIGAGATILAGVKLGDFTIVGAGAVVTKSFPEGYCVIAGNPAKVLKTLDPNLCVRYEHPQKYYGYLSEKKFKKYIHKHNLIG